MIVALCVAGYLVTVAIAFRLLVWIMSKDMEVSWDTPDSGAAVFFAILWPIYLAMFTVGVLPHIWAKEWSVRDKAYWDSYSE